MRTNIAADRSRMLMPFLVLCLVGATPLRHPTTVRILGVFDEQSFAPIAGADVIDLTTGTKAVTTETGTVSLSFLGQGSTVLHVRKVGYGNRMVPVNVSDVDTASITVVLTPLAPMLPTVVTTEKSIPLADPRWKLDMAGFYERQRTLSAPPSAYVTAEQIASWHVTAISNIKAHTGRGVCGDVYIDGIHQDMTALAAGKGNYRQGVDELLRVENVAGIEIYTAAEAPYPYFIPVPPPVVARSNGGRVTPSARAGAQKAPSTNLGCAVTLIWTK